MVPATMKATLPVSHGTWHFSTPPARTAPPTYPLPSSTLSYLASIRPLSSFLFFILSLFHLVASSASFFSPPSCYSIFWCSNNYTSLSLPPPLITPHSNSWILYYILLLSRHSTLISLSHSCHLPLFLMIYIAAISITSISPSFCPPSPIPPWYRFFSLFLILLP